MPGPQHGVVRVAQSSCFSQRPPALENLQGDVVLCKPVCEPAFSLAAFSCKKQSCSDPTLIVVCFQQYLFSAGLGGRKFFTK